MAGPSRFQLYVHSLMGRWNKQADVIARIKRNPTYRSVTNSVIQATINVVRSIKTSGKNYQQGKAKEQIGKFVTKGSGKGGNTVHINFEFRYNFPIGSSSGKQGMQKASMSVDVPATWTKDQVQSYIKNIVGQWVDDHYGSGRKQTATNTINITTLQGF